MTNNSAKPEREKGLFQVAVKLLLRDKNKLLLTHDIFGAWDLPGGRILPSEFGGNIANVIARKMHEELGGDVTYRLEGPKVCFQVERIEHDTKLPVRVFGVGFAAQYLGGTIQLGPHHDRYLWADMATLDPADYFKYGWERGVADYMQQRQPAE